MARSLVATCDRCQAVITKAPHDTPFTVVKTCRSDDQREILTKDDLCASCTEAFEDFMRQVP